MVAVAVEIVVTAVIGFIVAVIVVMVVIISAGKASLRWCLFRFVKLQVACEQIATAKDDAANVADMLK